MTNGEERFAEFVETLQQDVISEADLQGSENLRPQTFTERMIAELSGTGDLDDGTAVYHKSRGQEVSGYAVSDDETTLDLFASHFLGKTPPVSVPKTDVETAVKRLLTFYRAAANGLHREIEPASPVFDMAHRIFGLAPRLSKLRLFYFTDGLTSARLRIKKESESFDYDIQVWDARRLFRAVSSGTQRERIEIDLESKYGGAIACLSGSPGAEYQTYLAVVPGTVLASLYEDYGPRLLELNVRSFLQARGKVNKGIRKTILEEPGRFLAFNNGITATASEVELSTNANNVMTIRKLRDLQIVNGGQTTASLHHAAKVDRADLSTVYVQLKLTVVQKQRLLEFVPLVSRYANTQNKVNEADFAANGGHHVRLEELSRTVWAPAIGDSQRLTHWFYERARGQYQDELARAGTPARREQFKAQNPLNQKFTKTDLAKFENSWSQLPHVVSLGAEKNFREYSIRLGDSEPADVNVAYFHGLAARALLFRRAEKLVGDLELGGYRANVVAYSIAFIANRTNSSIDFDRIWREQAIGLGLSGAIVVVARRVFTYLTTTAAGRNVTEWAKRIECWEGVNRLDLALPPALYLEVAAPGGGPRTMDPVSLSANNRARVMATRPSTWKAIAKWSKDGGYLKAYQRTIAERLAASIREGNGLLPSDIVHGVVILDEAAGLGFTES